MRLMVLLLIIVSKISFAQKLETKIYDRWVDPGLVSSGQALPIWARGQRLVSEKPTGSYLSGGEDDLSEAYDNGIANANAQSISFEEAYTEIRREDLPEAPEIVLTDDPEESDVLESLPDVGPLDWEKFRTCAVENVPTLKSVLYRFQQNPQSPTIEVILNLLDSTRGDGQKRTPSGMICGFYLGKAGLSVAGREQAILLEETKFLHAASRASADEMKQLVRALVISRHGDAPVDSNGIWRSIYLRFVFRASFGKALGTELDVFAGEAAYHPFELPGGEMLRGTLPVEEIEKTIERGIEWFEKHIQ